MKYIYILLAAAILFTSCKKENELSEAEIIEGLKEALKVGTDTSATKLNKTDGYYADLTVKILLPPQASQVMQMKDQVPGLAPLVDDVILQINRSAEDAAIEAKPIFVNAITSIGISDGKDILFGADNAATVYLKNNTYNSLFGVYIPKMRTSLNKEIAGGVSAQSTWDEITILWNSYATTLAGQLLGMNQVNVALDTFVTQKGLDGLFLKVADEEKDIRNDPTARVNAILQKVFGELD
jgi:hypothetical protein